MSNLTRREVLGVVPAAMVGAYALGDRAQAQGKAAAYVPKALGVQLYTVRTQLGDLDKTLGAIKEIGFDEVETLRPVVKAIPPLLKKHGLKAPSGHFDAALVLDLGDAGKQSLGGYTFEQAIEDAKAADMQYFVLPYIGSPDRKSIDDYKRHADAMNSAAAKLKRAGLHFCYHHHSFEFVKYGEQTGWDVFVERLDKDLVGFECDVFWLAAAGLDPAATITKLGKRVKLVHLKDRAAGEPQLDESKVAPTQFKEVGSGTLDMPAILKAAKAVGVAHYFVEQDQVPADPIASLKQSITYLRGLKA
jgi:sugar phosphate isomerase/epimerase